MLVLQTRKVQCRHHHFAEKVFISSEVLCKVVVTLNLITNLIEPAVSSVAKRSCYRCGRSGV